MSRYVIDASVAVKWFVPEAHTDEALNYFDDDNDLFAPDLLASEFGNILWKKVRRQELTPDEARETITLFTQTPIDLIASRPLLEPAFEIATALDRTVYDSLYLALAVHQDCEMITADQRLYNSVQTSELRKHIHCLGVGS